MEHESYRLLDEAELVVALRDYYAFRLKFL